MALRLSWSMIFVLVQASLLCLVSQVAVSSDVKSSSAFYPFPQTANSSPTYEPPVIVLTENNEFGRVVSSLDIDKEYNYIHKFSVSEKKYIVSLRWKSDKKILRDEFMNFFERNFVDSKKTLELSNIYNIINFDEIESEPCKLFKYFYYINSLEEKRRKRFTVVRAFNEPILIDGNCAEIWASYPSALVESHSIHSTIRTDESHLFIPLPDGIAIIPAQRNFLIALDEPLPVAPSTWLVPQRWLDRVAPFQARSAQKRILTQDFLLNASRRVKYFLRNHSSYEYGDD